MIPDQILDMIDAGIITLDKDLKIIDWNKWIDFRSELKISDVRNHFITEIFPNLDNKWFKSNCHSVFKFGNFAFFSHKLHPYCIPLKTDGKYRDRYTRMQQDCTLGPIRNKKNEITGLFLTVRDVTEISHYQAELIRLANIDGLTEVNNRLYFEKRISEEVSRHLRFKRPMCIVMLDIDFFKSVNDNLGHQYGDFVLKELSRLILGRIREIDILSRYGGEEFIIILPETDLEEGIHVAESLRELIENHQFLSNGKKLTITISLGVSVLDENNNNSEKIIRDADEALYLSKEKGRNRVSTIVSGNKKL